MANPGQLPIQDGSEVPLPISIGTPVGSPRSRSGHSAHNLPQLETVMNQAYFYQQFQRNEYAFNPTLQTLHVATHGPAITSLVEETAERRHREVLGQTELQARRLQEALVLQEREEIARTKLAVGHEAAEYRQRCNQEATANCTSEEYKRVMDQNLRQSISNKDREIQQLRDEALVRDQHQAAQVQELQNMVHQQVAANQKLQQLLESNCRIPSNVHQVQSETADPIVVKPPKLQQLYHPQGLLLSVSPMFTVFSIACQCHQVQTLAQLSFLIP